MKKFLQFNITGAAFPVSTSVTLGQVYYWTVSSVDYYGIVTTAGTTAGSAPASTSGSVTSNTAVLQVLTSPSKTLMGLDNIATMQINSTSSMFVYYAGNTSNKVTITFKSADSTYATHYAVMQAINDAVVAASLPGGIYIVPSLPLSNAVASVVYA